MGPIRAKSGGEPAFAPIADDPRGQMQVLDQDILIALEARAHRRVGAQHHLLRDGQPLARGSASAFATARPGRAVHSRLAGPLHPGWRQLWRPRWQALQPRDLILESLVPGSQGEGLGAELIKLAEQPGNQIAQLGPGEVVERCIVGPSHPPLESHRAGSEQTLRPGICPACDSVLVSP